MITRELNVLGVTVNIAASGAWPIRYHKITGRDGLVDMDKIVEAGNGGELDLDIMYKLVYTLGTLAGFKGDEEAFYAQFPASFNIFEMFNEACRLIREDNANTKE